METLSNCPICNGATFLPFLRCNDHTVSRETFTIVSCSTCDFNFTNPRPYSTDLGKYYQSEDYISHSNSNKGFINTVYKLIRNYTIIKKVQLINRCNNNISKNILDVGSGTGEFLNGCKSAGWNVTGVEPSKSAALMAKENFNLSILDEEEIDNLEPNCFDIITMWHVLEHVPNLNQRVIELKKLLKVNGTIIIAVPNNSSYDAKFYKEYWGGYDVPRHLYHFKPHDIRLLCKNNNLKLVRVLPMRFDSFYVSMLSEKYKSGRIRLFRALWTGFISNIKAISSGEKFSSQIYIIKNIE